MRSRRDKKRARERDRNKRSRKYGQIKRKHSRKGIWSCVMAVLVTAVIAGLIVMAFMNKGKSAAMVGSFGVFDMILACIGIVTGVKGFKERDKNYLTCKIGIVVNGLIFCPDLSIYKRMCINGRKI